MQAPTRKVPNIPQRSLLCPLFKLQRNPSFLLAESECAIQMPCHLDSYIKGSAEGGRAPKIKVQETRTSAINAL